MDRHKPWVILLVTSLMVGASIGLVMNLTGVYYTPIARDLDLLLGSVSLHGTFTSLAMAFASLTIPKVSEKLGLKKMIFLGTVLAVLGTFLVSFATNLFLLYTAGIIRGIGSAYFSYVPMSMILNFWFKEKNGLAIGLAAGASGIVGAIAAPLFTLLIENNGWRFAFLVNGLFILLLMLPILLFPFELDPKDEGRLPYGHNSSREQKEKHQVEAGNLSFTNFIFVALMIIAFTNTLLVFMNAHFPGYGESLGLSVETGSLMLSGAMVGNLVWKMIFGVLSDRIGTVKTSVLMMTLSFLSLLVIIFWTAPIPLLIGSFFFGASFSIGGVAMPILSQKFFGPMAGTRVYSVVNFLATAGGAIGVSLTGYIYDFTGTYVAAFALGLVFNVVNIFLMILAKRSFDNQKVS